MNIAALMKFRHPEPTEEPHKSLLGRAALNLYPQGHRIIIGNRALDGVFSGWGVRNGEWEAVSAIPDAVYNRYPLHQEATKFGEIQSNLPPVPLANSPAVMSFCRDKLQLQRFLTVSGIDMPDVECDPERFPSRLKEWGNAYQKPRFGSFGAGVRLVGSSESIPNKTRGLNGEPQPTVLQRAIAPPTGWAGWSVRTLVQRDPGGYWCVLPSVLRRHRTDPVVNVARDAEVVPAEDTLSADTLSKITEQATAIATLISDSQAPSTVLELGLDFVIDGDGFPWFIEANGRPRGRLQILASQQPKRFESEALAATLRPIQCLIEIARKAKG